MVDQVYSHGAYLRGGNENVADKFKALTSYLWKNSEFSNQGQPIAASSMQKKFGALLKAFRDKHGFSDDGERANLSAIPEESSDIDLKLEEIHNALEEKRISDMKNKCKDAEKKKSISDVTDVISSGGGRKGLNQLAAETSSSLTSSSSTAVREFSEMGKSGPSRKRDRSQAKLEEEAEMSSIREQINVDIVAARAEEALRQQEREEAARTRVTIQNMAADIAQFKDDMGAILRKISE